MSMFVYMHVCVVGAAKRQARGFVFKNVWQELGVASSGVLSPMSLFGHTSTKHRNSLDTLTQKKHTQLYDF